MNALDDHAERFARVASTDELVERVLESNDKLRSAGGEGAPALAARLLPGCR